MSSIDSPKLTGSTARRTIGWTATAIALAVAGFTYGAPTFRTLVATPLHLSQALGRSDISTCSQWWVAPSARAGCYRQELLARILTKGPDVLPSIDAIARRQPDLGGTCHTIMHAVGREYSKTTKIKLANLAQYLPRSEDTNCAAGFAHGVMTDVASNVHTPEQASELETVCLAGPTRILKKNCIHGLGHAFMRSTGSDIKRALRLCDGLPRHGVECGPGVFHDYFLAAEGIDDAAPPSDLETDPERLCRDDQHARACWVRAMAYEFNHKSPRNMVFREDASARFALGRCRRLDGLQREGCLIGTFMAEDSRFGLSPPEQFRRCESLSARDLVSCLVVVNGEHVSDTFLNNCTRFDVPDRAVCYSSLAWIRSVFTNGATLRVCDRQSTQADRAACRSGAQRFNDPVDFF